MTSARLLVALTVVNAALVAYQAIGVAKAHAREDAQILRGRGLEIVDADGRVRAQVKVEPANPTYRWPDSSRCRRRRARCRRTGLSSWGCSSAW